MSNFPKSLITEMPAAAANNEMKAESECIQC